MTSDEGMTADLEPGDLDGIAQAVEAVLMVTDRPVTAAELADAIEVDVDLVETVLHELRDEWAGLAPGGDRDAGAGASNGRGGSGRPRPRGFELRFVDGGWRVYSSPRWAPVVGRFVVGAAQARLSQAALETLAVVAYRQPVSRSRISHIRGVNVDAVVRTLVTRGLIEEVGWTDSGARLYGTTTAFLERMGFESLDDLAPLAPFLPDREELDDLEESL